MPGEVRISTSFAGHSVQVRLLHRGHCAIMKGIMMYDILIGLGLTLVTQIVIFGFGYGKLTQKVNDVRNDVEFIKRQLFRLNGGSRYSDPSNEEHQDSNQNPG